MARSPKAMNAPVYTFEAKVEVAIVARGAVHELVLYIPVAVIACDYVRRPSQIYHAAIS
jgi:hypothetical protein